MSGDAISGGTSLYSLANQQAAGIEPVKMPQSDNLQINNPANVTEAATYLRQRSNPLESGRTPRLGEKISSDFRMLDSKMNDTSISKPALDELFRAKNNRKPGPDKTNLKSAKEVAEKVFDIGKDGYYERMRMIDYAVYIGGIASAQKAAIESFKRLQQG